MENQAIVIANHIVRRSIETGRLITNLHLQKSLYFLQAYFLMEYKETLFDDDMEMWRLGPVVPTVYDEYKQFGTNKIINVPRMPIFNRESLDITYEDEAMITEETKKVLNPLIDAISTRDPFYLVEKAIQHEMWKRNEPHIRNSGSARGKITYDTKEMYRFFSEKQNFLELMYEIF